MGEACGNIIRSLGAHASNTVAIKYAAGCVGKQSEDARAYDKSRHKCRTVQERIDQSGNEAIASLSIFVGCVVGAAI